MSSYLTANDIPGHHPNSWYAESAGPAEHFPSLNQDLRADVCVIGGGYAGLSTALHLAERGIEVILLEANKIGWGASGRNGGQLGIGPRAEIEVYQRMVGNDDARKVWDIAIAANQLVRDLIARYKIECDLANGYIEAAAKARHVRELDEFVGHVVLHYDHSNIRILDKSEMSEALGTERYHGGYYDGLGGHLHPLKLARGLARAASAAGGQIFESTAVHNVEPGRVSTSGGHVSAPEIIVACNGYLDGLVSSAQRRMLPINNFILATEPLSDERSAILNPWNVCVSDTLFVLNYFRLSPDQRLLWGGGESTGVRFPSDLKSLVRSRMLEIYPDNHDLEITHAWGGTLAITAHRMPLFQDAAPGVRAIGGWSGSGIHMATMGGKIAADAIAGELGEWDLLSRMPTPAFPGGDWFRMPLLRLAMFWYGLRDRI